MARKSTENPILTFAHSVEYTDKGMKDIRLEAPSWGKQDRKAFVHKVQGIVDKCAGGLIFTDSNHPFQKSIF